MMPQRYSTSKSAKINTNVSKLLLSQSTESHTHIFSHPQDQTELYIRAKKKQQKDWLTGGSKVEVPYVNRRLQVAARDESWKRCGNNTTNVSPGYSFKHT